MHSRHLFYLHPQCHSLSFSIRGSRRHFCSNLLNGLRNFRFAPFSHPHPPPPTALPPPKRPLWNANLVVLFLRLKLLVTACPGLSALPSCHNFVFVPFPIPFLQLYWAPVCDALLCSVPFPSAARCAWNAPESTTPFPMRLCSSPSRKCLRFSQAPLTTSPLCHWIVLLMRSCLLRPLFPIRLWIVSILFRLYSLDRPCSKFCRYHRKQNKTPSLVELLLPKGDRQLKNVLVTCALQENTVDSQGREWWGWQVLFYTRLREDIPAQVTLKGGSWWGGCEAESDGVRSTTVSWLGGEVSEELCKNVGWMNQWGVCR